MKKIFTLALCVFGLLSLQAQERYLDEIFDAVEVTEDVIYASNVSVLPALQAQTPMALPQYMDIYQPAGDTETARPLVLVFHTGNFLPMYLNGSALGGRKDSSVVELCNRFARMGYVTASVDYRLGWNPLAGTQVERTYQLVNAAYRGVQDARTAVRFFHMNAAEMGNEYNVDPNKVAMFGDGTGGYITLASASISDYNDIFVDDVGAPILSLWYDPGDGSSIPMVIESINGDPEAKLDGYTPDGLQLCIGHYPDYSSEFAFQMNMGGALGSAEWLDAGDPAMVSFHTPHDPFAPYTSGIVVVPTTNEPVIEATGSYNVHLAINSFADPNNNDSFQSQNLSDDLSLQALEINDGMDGLFPVLNNYIDGVPSEPYDSSPWQWWDVATTQAVDSANNSSIAGTQLSLNPTMGPEEAMSWLDIIQGYTAPRMAFALGLVDVTSVLEASAALPGLNAYPNPTNAQLQIDLDAPGQQLALYTMDGRCVESFALQGATRTVLDMTGFEVGSYILTVDGISRLVQVVK
ncbi:MAG: alpha/beta hydrolase fold domain-containing protein [Flavobacteriales bacterium]|nr:alpha/beta hydrolase fold domain-containing protein [Flavobacteriales bacterium]